MWHQRSHDQRRDKWLLRAYNLLDNFSPKKKNLITIKPSSFRISRIERLTFVLRIQIASRSSKFENLVYIQIQRLKERELINVWSRWDGNEPGDERRKKKQNCRKRIGSYGSHHGSDPVSPSVTTPITTTTQTTSHQWYGSFVISCCSILLIKIKLTLFFNMEYSTLYNLTTSKFKFLIHKMLGGQRCASY